MNRRQFLSRLTRIGLSAAALNAVPFKNVYATWGCLYPGKWIIDAHAHPYGFHRPELDPNDHTFDMMRTAGVVASSFAAVGDYIYYNDPYGSPYDDTMRQLKIVQQWEKEGYVRIMRRPLDILLSLFVPSAPICAILSIEGADALEGDLDKLNEFFDIGVRIITLVHDHNNRVGHDMREYASNDPTDPGLTDFGCQVVERMNQLGMVIDVAHSSTRTVSDVAAVTCAPIIDSHTNPLPAYISDRAAGRLRTYSEMEYVVSTGGVVGTWPLAYDETLSRLTFDDWAQEIQDFKEYFGIEHIGLGTDGGGGLPAFVEGWNDISDVRVLRQTMRERGFENREIAAFMGRNMFRVLNRCYIIGEWLRRKPYTKEDYGNSGASPAP